MKIRLHLCTTDSPVSAVVRWLTDSDFSHIEFVVDENTPQDLAKGRVGYLGALGHGGWQLRELNYDHWSREAILETDDLPDAVARRIWESAFSKVGAQYDWTALIGLGISRDWRNPNQWFCSEGVEDCFIYGGYPLLANREPVDRVTPVMLFMSTRLHPVLLHG
jgi:hypothetical protein